MKTSPNRAIKPALRSFRRSLKHIQSLARLNNSFMEWWALQDTHYCGKRDITEIHPATPHIDRISPFQVYRIYQETPLQYFPNTWVSAPCSDISRCRNCAQNLPMANSPSFYSSPPKYHLFRPHSDIPSPSAQVPTCFGETPTSGGRSQSDLHYCLFRRCRRSRGNRCMDPFLGWWS